ncbi:MAG: S46 family peptidase, partial [Gemmatimonadota bacterium]
MSDRYSRARALTMLAFTAAAGLTAPASAQTATPDSVRAGRFDSGKMWTFEYAPARYFTETYGFRADSAWFASARMSALRIPGCSASFVSPNGLVVTNHHCARGSVTRVTREGESLLDTGFYAKSLSEERPIANYYADQLIAIQDVSGEVFAALDAAPDEATRRDARSAVVGRIQERLQGQYGQPDRPVRVEVRALYNGGRYSGYVFRRYTDVRLVAAAELQLGFFGGDADNFTYPRHALDFAFFRIYGDDGRPLQTPNHFTWSRDGVQEGDVVFVIGNPGPTNRLNTVAQLEYLRDVQVPAQVAIQSSRLAVLTAFMEAHKGTPEAAAIRNTAFGISNSLKAGIGRLDALNRAEILARRRDAERMFRDSIAARPELESRYGSAFDRIAEIQTAKRAFAADVGAFAYFESSSYSPAILRRALEASAYLRTAARAPADSAAARRRLASVRDGPPEIEQQLLADRLADFRTYFGDTDPITRAALQGQSPEVAASALLAASALADQAGTERAVTQGTLAADPAVRLMETIIPRLLRYQTEMSSLNSEEAELESDLGRARFEVYGTSVPPDATSSPRITDGVVMSYDYNGTKAPPYTTFFGLYDLNSAFGQDSEWNLPDRWLPPPPELDLDTPLNFVSTADTYGGNSGSPAVTPELEIVGLNFDRNIEGLSRDYIYLPERGRNIMVDVRAILEALDDVYDADRIVLELTT